MSEWFVCSWLSPDAVHGKQDLRVMMSRECVIQRAADDDPAIHQRLVVFREHELNVRHARFLFPVGTRRHTDRRREMQHPHAFRLIAFGDALEIGWTRKSMPPDRPGERYDFRLIGNASLRCRMD